MKLLLAQPPLTQLNTPYPAIHCLKRFLSTRGFEARAIDLSIVLARKLFSREGLAKVFSDAEAALAAKTFELGQAAYQVERYLSSAPAYLDWIDTITRFLSGEDDEAGHAIANGFGPPLGARAEAFRESRGGIVGFEETRLLASLFIEDLADFIRFTIDPEFSLVQYAHSKSSSQAFFYPIETSLDSSYLMREFYAPLLRELLPTIVAEAEGKVGGDVGPKERVLLGLSIPFPGCLVPALETARVARSIYGDRLTVVAGGGYPSTELRAIKATRVFEYFDCLALDSGLIALEQLARAVKNAEEAGTPGKLAIPSGLSHCIRLNGERIVFSGFAERDRARQTEAGMATEDSLESDETRAIEERALRELTPDYSDADFSRYLRFQDSLNPMHSLWSNGKWLKARMANGCYWHGCAFCDVELEYIHRYLPSDPEYLFARMVEESKKTGLRGIHFVDEALPLPLIARFAAMNIASGLPLRFWGNFRFEPTLTPDLAAFLAAGGLVGFSAGIESATSRGLESLNKGIGIEDVIRACAALKTAGVLVHAYMIYGSWDEEPNDLLASMECLRQLFSAGLLDSAYWHKFVLTRHSRAYAEWKAGRLPGIEPIELPWEFADNDVPFKGERKLERYAEGLEASLAAWMAGEDLNKRPHRWFAFKTEEPNISPDFVKRILASADSTEYRPMKPNSRVAWIGGRILQKPMGSRIGLSWAYRGELARDEYESGLGTRLAIALEEARPRGSGELLAWKDFAASLGLAGEALSSFESSEGFSFLRDNGLCLF